MTITELKKTLNDYSESKSDCRHVVVAVMPDESLVVNKVGVKLEIHDLWCDGDGVLNIIAIKSTAEIDPNLRLENDLLGDEVAA